MRTRLINTAVAFCSILAMRCNDLGEIFIPPPSPPDLVYDAKNWEVYQMGADGSNKTLLSYVIGQHVLCSRDHNLIAVMRMFPEPSLVIYDRILMRPKKLAVMLELNTSGFMSFSWSPDGSKLAFTKGWGMGFDQCSLCIVDTGGTEVRELTRTGANWDYRWSPDGRTISFFKYQSERKRTDAYFIDSDGTNMRPVPYMPLGKCTPVEWSPDGRLVVFESLPDTAGPEIPAKNDIYVSDFVGTNITRITYDECSSVPHWSPNGRAILFASRRMGSWNLFVMSPNGTNVKQITRHGSVFAGEHRYSPDGSRIAYVYAGPQGGAGTIHVVNADGSGDTDTGAAFADGFDGLR